jgi:ATP-dependent DNA helicase RecG
MGRGRKFRDPRRHPETERALFEQKLTGRHSRVLDRADLLSIIRGGEDTHVEFKLRLVNAEKIMAEIAAMANAGGGCIVFGVSDQRRVEGLDDPEQVEEQLIDICRNQIKPPILPRIDKVSFDNGVRVVVLEVDDRRAPHATADNRYFIRVGSTKREADGGEIAQLFARSRSAAFEEMPMVAASIDDIDEALVWSYIRDLEGELFRDAEGFPTGLALRDLRLAVDYGPNIIPTLAGFLLFGRNSAIKEIFPQSQLTLTRFSGADASSPAVESLELWGNLASLFERAETFIKRYVDLWEGRPPRSTARPSPVPARANYPRDAVIEALTNMLVHRDYSMTNPRSRIWIFDDRIEFINPSRTSGQARRSIEYGAGRHENPLLYRIFTSPEYRMDSARRGIPALRRAHYAFTRREPRISLLGDEFRLELYGA